MKFFVSSKFSEKERVKDAYSLIKQMGHTITHEWVHNEASSPFSQNSTFAAKCASEDIDGVRLADVFVIFSSAEPSTGASAELGAALATSLFFKKLKVYAVGPHFDANFFFWHPAVIQKNSIEEVLDDLQQHSDQSSSVQPVRHN